MPKYLTRPVRVAVTVALLAAAGSASTAMAAETVVDRSAFSTTVKAGGDVFKTRTYPEAVNFQEGSGKWSEIDRTLVPQSDGTVRPAAVDGDAVIPSTLTEPVVLEHDGRSVSFRLLGADAGADRDTAGTKASFDDALSGVDVSYKVRPNGLKELLTLQSKTATRAFAYDVRADSDLTAAIEGGDLVFEDDAGAERFRVAAPLAWDSAELPETANALTLSVTKTGDRQWRLTMRADDKWLDDPTRVYPARLDPDYYWVDNNFRMRFHGANADCALAGGSLAGQQRCAYDALQIGYGNGRPYKSTMKFDLSTAIPTYATATDARFLAFQFPNSTSKAPVSSRLRTITRDWDNTATWNAAKTGTTSATTAAWTTPGSDTSTDPNLTGPAITVGPSGYWSYWPAPLNAVNGWIKGTLPNHGFQISTETTYPNVVNAYEFTSTEGNQEAWPALEVTWIPDAVAPDPVTSFRVSEFDSTGVARIAWDTPTDPKLSNGTDGSGVASTSLAVSIDGVARPVQTTTTTFADIPNVAVGNQVQATLTVTDRAGNSRTASLNVPSIQVLYDDPLVDSAAADSYQSERGGTRAQALAWIIEQNKAINSQNSTPDGDILTSVRAAATPSGFGGMYFDDATRQLVVRLTPQANVAAVNNFLGSLGVSTRVDNATITADRLYQVQSDIWDQLSDLTGSEKVEVRADATLGRFNFRIASSATVAEKARIQAQSTDSIPATYVETTDSLLATPEACSTSYCDAPVRGGVYINVNPGNESEPIECSLGLMARRGGQRYGVTAGHCNGWADGDTRIDTRSKPVVYGTRPQLSGTYAIGNTGSVTYSKAADYLLISYPPLLDAGSLVLVTSGPNTTRDESYKIIRSTPNIPNKRACMTGMGTKTTICGRVTSVGAIAIYPSPFFQSIENVASVTYCSKGGDSGGPVFSGHMALGIHSGSRKVAGKCVEAYYTGAKTIESLQGNGFKFGP